MTHVILSALVPIFFVILLGFFAGRVRDIDNHHVGELNALVMQFALPASLFVATAATARKDMLREASLFALLGGAMLLLYASWYLLQRHRGASRAEAALQAITVSLPNYAAAGLPVALAVAGPAGATHVAIAIAAGSILPSPITLFILERSRSDGGAEASGIWRALRLALTKPIVLAPVLGTTVSLTGVTLGPLVTAPLQLIGQAAGGVALFLTGLVLSAQDFRMNRNVVGATLLGNIVRPVLVLGAVSILPVPADIGHAAVLLAALPGGFFGILFGVSYKQASAETGSMVIASTVFSAVTLTVAILFLFPK